LNAVVVYECKDSCYRQPNPGKPTSQRRNVMTTKSEVYKCNACGAIIAVISGGKGELVCCDQKMVEVTPDKAKKLLHDMARPGTP
jgi:desulfoferrodoxin-like iron-binding protein